MDHAQEETCPDVREPLTVTIGGVVERESVWVIPSVLGLKVPEKRSLLDR